MSAVATPQRTSTPPNISTGRITQLCGPSNPVRNGAGATSTRLSLSSPDVPALPFNDWETTCDTLHMWTQIVGKTALAFAAPVNHWWQIAFQVTPKGLRTGPIPWRHESFDVEFDFLAHRVVVGTSAGQLLAISMHPRSVADFYFEYMAGLHSLGIDVRFRRTPVEFHDTTPFDEDRHHA